MASVEEASKSVEIVVETEAGAGASGYSVTGGGERGIFVKDVLKDSPAAKHLSLQQGDQLLSAKVYFDNVRYEDALKILQCAEPYRVSFQLKRTILGADGSVRPKVPSVEVKGPKVKMAKMVKEELVVEGTPPRLEMSDVEFSLPKFKQRKSPKVEVEEARGAAVERKAKKRMRLAFFVLETGRFEGQVNISPSEMPGAKVKSKEKGHKFGITFPTSKHTKSGSTLETGSVELKPPGVNIQPPSVEFSLSANKDVEKGASKVSIPDVEFALPSGKAETSLPNVKGTAKIKASEMDIKGRAETAEGKVNVDADKGDAKVRMPKLKLPKVRLSHHSDEIDGDIKVKAGGIKMPHTDIKPPEVEIKGDGQIGLPSVDISLPKVKGKTDILIKDYEGIRKTAINMPASDISVADIDLELDSGRRIPDEVEGTFKGPKISMPKVDISLPKMGSSVDTECPEVEGKFSLPSVELSLPKVKSDSGDVYMDYYVGGDGKFKMPDFDISQPGEVNIRGQGVEGEFKLPKVDLILPKGKAGMTDVKGEGNFHPKIKLPDPDVKLEGPELPGVDFSLSKPNTEANVELSGSGGDKFQLPTFDISLPKVPTKEGEFDIESKAKGGAKFNVPSLDFSLPVMKSPEGEVKIESPEVKGRKFQMPSLDVSLPKMKMPEGNLVLEGPSLDISPPKGKAKGKAEGDIQVKSKGEPFQIPSVDVSLPQIKSKQGDINVEGPEITFEGNGKGGKFNVPSVDIDLPVVKMPTVDISLPKGKEKGEVDTGIDINTEGPEGRGGKITMPKFDISLPKVNFPEGDVKLKGPETKGRKIEMPDIDISLPKGKVGEKIEGHTGKGNKFNMPSINISLPKMKSKRPDINTEGPHVKGKIKVPSVDVSLPKGKVEGDINIEGPEMKGGKFKMPKFDVSLPKVSLPEGGVKIKGPDTKGGTIEIPEIDISLPKAKAHGEIDLNIKGPGNKGSKFTMPKVDISLPKMNFPEGDIKVEGPNVKGEKVTVPEGKVEGDINIEGLSEKGRFDIPKIEVDKKGGGFHMPTLDINLPKFDLDLSLPSGVNAKGFKVDTPSPDASGDLEMSGLTGGLNPAKLEVKNEDIGTGGLEGPGASLKLPTVKLPTVDISAPKMDLNFGLTKPKGDDVEVELLKAEGGRPSSGGSFDLPVFLKVPSFTLPRFGGKTKSCNLEIPAPKGDTSLSSPHVEGEIRAPSVEFDGGGKVKVKKPKIKLPSFGMSKKAADVSVSCPDVDVKGKKGKIDIHQPDINVDNSDDMSKYKMKFPKLKISSPKSELPAEKVEAKLDADVEAKGGFHAPDVSLKLPKFSMPGFVSKEKDLGKPSGDLEAKTKVKMPSVELSLPAAKTPETEVLLPKAEVDVTEADIRGYEGNLKIPKMPTIDVSLPKLDLDVSLPRGKSPKIEGPDLELKGGDGKFKRPHFNMPALDISLPKAKTDSPDLEMKATTEGKLKMPHIKMPNIDISLPKGKLKGTEAEIEVDGQGEAKVKTPYLKMPNADVSLPKGHIEGPEIEIQGEGGKFKMPHLSMPSVDISLPKGKIGGPDVEVEGHGKGKFKMPHWKKPDVDISLTKGQIEGPEVELKGEGGKFKIPHLSMPSVDISLHSGKTGDAETETEGNERAKFKTPQMKMPSVDISAPKGKIEGADLEMNVDVSLPKGRVESPGVRDVEIKGEAGKFKMPHINMPSVDISLPKGKTEGAEIELEGGAGGGIRMPQVKMPGFNVSLPKGKAGKIKGEMEIEGDDSKMPHMTVPSVNISLPTGETEGANAAIKGEGGIFRMPKVDISLPKGKPSVQGPEADIKGDRGEFKMPNVGISLPKGKVNIDTPAEKMETEGGIIKLPDIKMPKVDISLPKGKSKGSVVPVVEMKVTSSDIKVPEGQVLLPMAKTTEAEINLPSGKADLDTGALGEADLHFEGEHKGLKLKVPTIDIKGPKGGLELDTGLHKGEGKKDRKKVDLPDLDVTTETSSKVKGPKVKGTKFKIGMPKKKNGGKRFEYFEVKTQNGHKDDKNRVNHPVPEVTLPSVSLKTEVKGEGGSSSPHAGIRLPKIPDIEFDIGSSQDGDDSKTEKGKKIKIPKFGIPLPSLSSPEESVNVHGPEIQYEGPKMPKVKKAVFVLVDTPTTNEPATSTSPLKGEATETVKVKMPKIEKKPSQKSAAASAEKEGAEEEKSKGGIIKMPKVSFSSGKSASFGGDTVKREGSSSSLNGESPHKGSKEEKVAFSGKVKLPKVEFTSLYGKMGARGADMETSGGLGKHSSPEEVQSSTMLPGGFTEEPLKDLVSSRARTEMLDRDSSESPSGFATEFTSTKFQAWSKVESKSRESEERESSSWFKVPKVTLKPHATGKAKGDAIGLALR
uniref:PDZ domain-containing protein n=1 Tax=Neolamprologus brichardi TaxID=32507 RepID=A0A3Q4HIG4_NEOBR